MGRVNDDGCRETNPMKTISSLVRALFGKRRLDADKAEEKRSHRKRCMQANVTAGMSNGEARSAAQRQFGPRRGAKVDPVVALRSE